MKHQEHIVCVKANCFPPTTDGWSPYQLNAADIMVGQRALLEHDEDFRQILSVAVFTHQGKVWTYYRTKKSGEVRLHDKLACCVGGHWDISDLVVKDNIILLEDSIKNSFERELEEEIILESRIVDQFTAESMICANDTEVDRVHAAMVTFIELDDDAIRENENKLTPVGFFEPQTLLDSDKNLETWTRLVCEYLLQHQSQ